MSEARNIVLITGTSGTGIKDALKRYCQTRSNTKPAFVEDYVPEVAEALYRRLEPEDSGAVTLLKTLVTLPHPALQKLWPAAFELMFAREELASVPADKTIFLQFHAAWYHIASDRFISEVNHPMLHKYCAPRARMVVTLLDDIYDTYVRLSRFAELFHPGSDEVRNPLSAFISDLLRLLSWREMEIRFAQQCAETLEVPHYILGIKHPTVTFERLVSGAGTTLAYLAHPISVPRKGGRGGYGGLASEESQLLIGFINDVAYRLRSNDNIVLFEPTTIDELRYPEQLDASRLLTDRWPTAKDDRGGALELLVPPLSPVEAEQAMQPFRHLLEEDVSEADVSEAHGALDVLKAHIARQINWRDRQLVEQARYLIQVRPCASPLGTVSGGVAEEAKLHSALITTAEKLPVGDRGLAIIYHPPSDELRRQRGSVYAVSKIHEDNHRAANVTACEEALRAALSFVDVQSWLSGTDEQIGLAVERIFDDLAVADRPKLVPGRTFGAMERGEQYRVRTQTRNKLGGDVREAINGNCESPDYHLGRFRGQGCVWLEQELAAEALADHVVGLISENENSP